VVGFALVMIGIGPAYRDYPTLQVCAERLRHFFRAMASQ
jgi:hypothetical protein